MERMIDTHVNGNGHATAPLGVGIAGLGRSGWRIHAHTLREMSRLFRVAAVMDVEAERAKEVGAELGCPSVTTYEALIATPGVDVVVVASPSHLHTQHTLDAIAAGHHVVCEKPFALDADSAARMIAAAEAAGRVIAPFQN
ncbi:MAG: Gfo/Idh/MocA family oxidoreductase, partial [Planctomycetota bacterium]